jgi:hypothetical protein
MIQTGQVRGKEPPELRVAGLADHLRGQGQLRPALHVDADHAPGRTHPPARARLKKPLAQLRSSTVIPGRTPGASGFSGLSNHLRAGLASRRP